MSDEIMKIMAQEIRWIPFCGVLCLSYKYKEFDKT